ncbi:MAG: hypothetical protein IVW36_11370 [Dehalococcoidia bacterium]|nr:hypothetical protein [Dehalococcoidia bacterium]
MHALGAVVFALIVGATFAVVGARSLGAADTANIAVSPLSQSELWYKPTPLTFTVNASNLSGPGLPGSPVAGYQYALSWDPSVLRWISGPEVGPGTPTPVPVLSCTNNPQRITWGTATSTPIGFVPTYTPTSTNTPLTTTPTNTPTATFTPSQTPTPGGYIYMACATISGTAVPSGVIGTFKFQPIATGPKSTAITLRDVIFVDHWANIIPSTSSSGTAALVNCNDLNADGRVNGLDLGVLAGHFLASVGDPRYLAVADINKDGAINGIDLSLLAGSFLQTC